MRRVISVVMMICIASSFIIAAQPESSIEVLVRTKDGPGGRAKGDIITVKKSPAGWGKCEGLPDYIIVKVTGVAVRDFAQYNIRHGKLRESDMSKSPETVRSKYRIDIDGLKKPKEGKVTATLNTTITNTIDRRAEILTLRKH